MNSTRETSRGNSARARNLLRSNSGKKRLLLFATGATVGTMGMLRKGWFGRMLVSAGGYFIYRSLASAGENDSYTVVSQTINRPVEEVYGFLRDPKAWIRANAAETNIHNQADGESKREDWVDFLEIINEVPNESVEWRYGKDKIYEAEAHFAAAPGDRGTEVWVFAHSNRPAGPIAKAFKLAGGLSLEQVAREQLRHCKELLEAGEIPTVDGQPSGARGIKGKVMRVAMRENPVESKGPSKVTPIGQSPERAAS
jgi:uncharacterized membrane protein